jgi:hypothetical protein
MGRDGGRGRAAEAAPNHPESQAAVCGATADCADAAFLAKPSDRQPYRLAKNNNNAKIKKKAEHKLGPSPTGRYELCERMSAARFAS